MTILKSELQGNKEGRRARLSWETGPTVAYDHSSNREIKIQIPISGSIESVSLEPGNSYA